MLPAAAMLSHLHDHDVLGSLEPQPGVLGDDLTRLVLGGDLVAVSVRCCEVLEHHALHYIREVTKLFRSTPVLDDVDVNERHDVLLDGVMGDRAVGGLCGVRSEIRTPHR
nr:hypothetical protein GCM10017611_22970 [Rhodococcus wratislaviensis]